MKLVFVRNRKQTETGIEYHFEYELLKRDEKGTFVSKNKGTLGSLGHIHGLTLLPNCGDQFIIVNGSGGKSLENRVLFYTLDGKRVKSLGIGEMFENTGKIIESISHIRWLTYRKGKSPIQLNQKKGTIQIDSLCGKATISLKNRTVQKE